MLTQFQVERHFNKLHASLYVEHRGRETLASLVITYDRRIVWLDAIRPYDVPNVATPEKAETWLSETVTQHGSRIETWENEYRSLARAA